MSTGLPSILPEPSGSKKTSSDGVTKSPLQFGLFVTASSDQLFGLEHRPGINQMPFEPAHAAADAV